MAQQTFKYVPTPGVERLLSRAPLVGVALGRRAERVAKEARAIAKAEAYDTGAYHDSIEAEHGLDEHGSQAGIARATDWKAGLIEFGTSERAAKAPLRRGADAAGVHLRRGP